MIYAFVYSVHQSNRYNCFHFTALFIVAAHSNFGSRRWKLSAKTWPLTHPVTLGTLPGCILRWYGHPLSLPALPDAGSRARQSRCRRRRKYCRPGASVLTRIGASAWLCEFELEFELGSEWILVAA